MVLLPSYLELILCPAAADVMFEYARRLQFEAPAPVIAASRLRSSSLLSVINLLEALDKRDQFVIDMPLNVRCFFGSVGHVSPYVLSDLRGQRVLLLGTPLAPT